MNLRIQRLTMGLFLLMLYAPLTVMLLTPDQEVSYFENRKLAQAPELPALVQRPLKEVFTTLEAYVSDQFGLRNGLAFLHGALYALVFRTSPSDSVLIGEDGWLFYAGAASEHSIEDYRGLKRLSDDYLRDTARYLQERKDWLAEQGIAYIFVLAPDKHTIYPDKIPDQYTVIDTERRIDQFIAYIEAHTDVDVLDLRQPLYDARTAGLKVFHQYDTHWSWLGGLVGYDVLLNKLHAQFPDLTPIPLDDWTAIPDQHPGDLGNMMGLGPSLIEAAPRYAPPDRCATEISEERREQLDHAIAELPYWVELHYFVCPEAKLNALMFHDSFGDRMWTYMAEHFSQTLFVKARYEPVLARLLVAFIQPDVVIEEIVERRLQSYFDYGK